MYASHSVQAGRGGETHRHNLTLLFVSNSVSQFPYSSAQPSQVKRNGRSKLRGCGGEEEEEEEEEVTNSSELVLTFFDVLIL